MYRPHQIFGNGFYVINQEIYLLLLIAKDKMV